MMNNTVKKTLISAILICFLLASAGCDALWDTIKPSDSNYEDSFDFSELLFEDDATKTGNEYLDKLVSRDYKGAYEYIYSLTDDVQSEQEYIDRYQNIYDALKITGISLGNKCVERGATDDEYTFEYTLKMKSDLLGDISYDYSTDIINTPLGYCVIYTPNLILPMLEDGDKVRIKTTYGERGEIFTADQRLLAKNDFAQSIYLDLREEHDIEQVKSFLNEEYQVDTDKAQRKYDNAVEKEYPIEVFATFPRNTLSEDEINLVESVGGLGVDDTYLTAARYYPLMDNAAHIVGYLGYPTEEQLEQYKDFGITESSLVGKYGLELAYEETLRAADGKKVYIEDDRGEEKEILYEEKKENGQDLYLTIDSNMQNAAYTLMATNCKPNESGAVVVMDYTNGDVKAMVSYPSFDNNLFNFPISTEVWEYYNAEESLQPLFSRATQAKYMPGSTFKVFSSIPAINEGLLNGESSPDITITKDENGVDNWIPDMSGITWIYPSMKRYKTPEAFNYEICIKSSDNIFFAYYSLAVGMDDMLAYMEQIGMGEAPDFELPVTPSNKIEQGDPVNYHMLGQLGYGIGDVLISPLQLASMYTAIMNEGDMINPTIVKKVVQTTLDDGAVTQWENSRTVFKEDVMRPDTIETMIKPAMRRVITDGSASGAGLSDISGLIAKTGTSQIGEDKSIEVNWIVAINPNDNLIYLVVVETESDVGVAPKLAVLKGLIQEESYTEMLTPAN